MVVAIAVENPGARRHRPIPTPGGVASIEFVARGEAPYRSPWECRHGTPLVEGLHPHRGRRQHRPFDLGGELCVPGFALIAAGHVEQLEQSLDALNADLPPLKDFILPGGNLEAAHCHLARTISRRAERRVATLARQERLNPQGLRYGCRTYCCYSGHVLSFASRCLFTIRLTRE